MGDTILKMAVDASSGVVEVTLSGVISEKAGMDPDEVTPGKDVIIDAGGVLRINSFGVRTWVNFLNAVCEKASRVGIRRLPPALVTQASMVANFLSSTEVESFFTPWCCIDCGHEALKLHQANDEIPEIAPCPECNSEMEFDDIRESYLAFRDTN